MIQEDLDIVVKFISDKYKYKVRSFSDTVKVFCLEDSVIRLILSINDDNALDVAFSPVCNPSEISMVSMDLYNIYNNINVTKDFYFSLDKKLHYGHDAMVKYMCDCYRFIKEKEEKNKDKNELDANDALFVTNNSIYAATGDVSLDKMRQGKRRYSSIAKINRK